MDKKDEVRDEIGPALFQLRTGIAHADRIFSEFDDAGRSGAILALQEVGDFIHRAFPATNSLALEAIGTALASLDMGIVAPLVEARKAGKPPAPPGAIDLQAVLAACITFLVETGPNSLSVADACKTVATAANCAALTDEKGKPFEAARLKWMRTNLRKRTKLTTGKRIVASPHDGYRNLHIPVLRSKGPAMHNAYKQLLVAFQTANPNNTTEETVKHVLHEFRQHSPSRVW